jgi:hypothetical protein
MIDKARSWFHDNQTLVYFLVAQFVAIGAAVLSMTAYMVRLETRVVTLEVRGSPHLAEINNRLTVLEKTTDSNTSRIERIVTVMTKELHISPMKDSK